MSWNNSLHNRLFITLALGIGVCLIALLGLFDTLVDRELYRRFDSSLTNRARVAAVFFGARADAGALSEQQVLPEFRLGQHREFYQVWDARGQVVARSKASENIDLDRPHTVSGAPQHFDLSLPDGHRGRAVAQAFALPVGDARVALTVVVAEERDEIDALERRLHAILIVGTIVTLLVTLVLVRLAVRRGLQPVDAYAKAVSDIDPSRPMQVPASDELPSELTPVARQFTNVLNRLTDALDRERRFSRDVAHELRTPIAEARALAETGALNDSPEAMRIHLREIAAATGELESIVASLLSIARYESGIEKINFEPIDLAAELKRHIDRVSALAAARNLRLTCQVSGDSWIQSDATLLTRIFANLVDNAVAHSPSDSEIRIDWDATEHRLRFANPAPLLDERSVAQLGHRFARAPTVATGQHHAGLGLSLCRTMAHAIGLDMTIGLVGGQLQIDLIGFSSLTDAASSSQKGQETFP